jgi:hypothetical protein
MRFRSPDISFAAAFAAMLLLAATPAMAHGGRPAGAVEGIRIESLTHGQMAVLADYRGEILDLAARSGETDEPFRRVLNYANIQFSFCMWGLMPGSVKDEESPFNECSHAYLAAVRDVFLRMQALPGPHRRVDALASRIDADMVRNRASLVLCQYSDEAFYTGDVVYPDWRNVLSHPSSLATFAGFWLLAAGGLVTLARATRQAPKSA